MIPTNTSHPYTLITGASSGIGLELAREFAAHGHCLVITATNELALANIAQSITADYGVDTRYIAVDFCKPDAAQQLFDSVQSQGIEIDILVNNAGIGKKGNFSEQTLESQQAIIQINIETVVELTHLFAPLMKARGRGRILNVASIAGFIPGPLMSIYHATKAFVLSFSLALGSELAATGVTVTALCPGATDTNFFQRAGATRSIIVQKGQVMSAIPVAEAGYRALMKGKPVEVVGVMNKLMIFFSRFLPSVFLVMMTKLFYTDLSVKNLSRNVRKEQPTQVSQFG